MPRDIKESSKDQTTSTKTNNGDKYIKHVETTEDLTQVADPVEAFQEFMEIKGYMGMLLFSLSIIIMN